MSTRWNPTFTPDWSDVPSKMQDELTDYAWRSAMRNMRRAVTFGNVLRGGMTEERRTLVIEGQGRGAQRVEVTPPKPTRPATERDRRLFLAAARLMFARLALCKRLGFVPGQGEVSENIAEIGKLVGELTA